MVGFGAVCRIRRHARSIPGSRRPLRRAVHWRVRHGVVFQRLAHLSAVLLQHASFVRASSSLHAAGCPAALCWLVCSLRLRSAGCWACGPSLVWLRSARPRRGGRRGCSAGSYFGSSRGYKGRNSQLESGGALIFGGLDCVVQSVGHPTLTRARARGLSGCRVVGLSACWTQVARPDFLLRRLQENILRLA